MVAMSDLLPDPELMISRIRCASTPAALRVRAVDPDSGEVYDHPIERDHVAHAFAHSRPRGRRPAEAPFKLKARSVLALVAEPDRGAVDDRALGRAVGVGNYCRAALTATARRQIPVAPLMGGRGGLLPPGAARRLFDRPNRDLPMVLGRRFLVGFSQMPTWMASPQTSSGSGDEIRIAASAFNGGAQNATAPRVVAIVNR
jgi:hypothetical protein